LQLVYGGAGANGLLGDVWLFNTQTACWSRAEVGPEHGASLAMQRADAWGAP
jgi:hypothetical protein